MNGASADLCPYCFRELPPDGKCSCAYESSSNFRIKEALRPGMIVGACYQIGGVLGRGGFAITYLGYDLDLEKVVAIKEFFPEGMVARNLGADDISERREKTCDILVASPKKEEVYRKSLDLFYREARALGRLGDLPNVVHVYRIFRENNTAYIVMDYVEGKPLKTIIREMGRIPEDKLLPLLDPVLTALQKVHEAGILHRDVAPDNILIDKNGRPVLLDFGAARIDSESHSSLIIGKKGFSSPEQIGGGLQDARSDIYALGTTYYYALSGIKPQDSVMRAINDDVVPLKEVIPEISERLSVAVMKAMAVKPDDRWPDVRSFQTALNMDEGPIPADMTDAANNDVETEVFHPDPNISEPESEPEPTQALLPQPQVREKPGIQKPQVKRQLLLLLIIAALLIVSGLIRYFLKDTRLPDPVPWGTGTLHDMPVIGGPYYFGNYEQDDDPENGKETIKWRVLALEENEALLISEYALDMQDFNINRAQKITWENSDLRKWLNGEFYDSAFSPEEKGKISESELRNSDRPVDDTIDRVFLLSYAEAGEYFASDEDRQCRATAYARSKGADVFDSSARTRWWIRSGEEDPVSTEKWAAVVWAYGSREFISDINTMTNVAVRPAIRIRLN